MRRSAFLFLLCAGALLAFAGAASASPSWLPAQTLTATDSKAPVVAVAPDGTTVLAWSRVDGATTVVEAVRRRPGEAFGTPVKLNAAEGSNPRVGIDAAGNATIAWEEDGVGVRAARLPAATGFEAAATVVANGSGAELAVGAGGTAVVVAQVAGVLQAAIRPGASGAFGTATPISAGTVLDPDVAVAPDGRAAVAWLEGGDILLDERPAGGGFAAAGTIRSRDEDAYEVSEPAVAIDGAGRGIVVWTEDDLGTAAEGTYLNSSVEPGAWVSYWHPTSRSADLVTGPGGAVVGTWVENAFLGVGDLTPGTGSWTNFGVADPTPAAGTAPAVAVGGDNATVAAWASGSGVHAARRAAGTNLLTSAQLATGAGAGDPSLGADGQGNATAAWLSPARRVTVASFDNAVPVLTAVSVPATGRAGGPALAMSAAASDRLGPVTLHWTFGDGATATGSAVRHAFGAAGTYQVGVTAVDAAGTSSRAVRSVTVAAAPKPPPRPQVARVAASADLRWRVRGKQIKLERMRLTRMPAGAEAELRCKGKRCPIRRTRIFTPSKRGAINVVKPLEIDQRRFRAGQRLDLRISAAGHVGQVLRFNLRRGKQPKALQRCMPIGSTSVRQSC
ncbi:MAG: PKD domain-containing protein [Solirubrobacteraceae bacterium]